MRRSVPNFITILNLLSGVAGIWFIFESNPFTGALLVFLAAIFDFADGMAARLLNAYSPVGKSLDSLADAVSFGVLPGVMVFKLQSITMGAGADFQWSDNFSVIEKIMLLLPLLIPAFSAMRLAKFDNDERQTSEFRGLPTPANAIFIASWLASYPSLNEKAPWLYNPYLIAAVTTALAFLMISDVTMFSLKLKSLKLKENVVRYIFLAISIVLIAAFRLPGIMGVILCYILISIIVPDKKTAAKV